MTNILISGGSDGLGKALAESLAQKYQVVILSQDADKTTAVAKNIGCDFVVADVSDAAQVETAMSAVIKKYGAIDCLINNAGLWIQGKLETNEPSQIKRVLEVNTLGTILLTLAVLPHMKEKKHGRIINVISQAGLYGKAERTVYNATKWAITGFTKSLALELVGTDVTVTGFYPGSMDTGIFAKTGDRRDTSRYMKLSEMVRVVTFIIETPNDLEIPELGIKPSWY